MRATVTHCKCGMRHIYYQYGKRNDPPEIEVCKKCGELPHNVIPGELGKIKIHVITQAICPACGEIQKVKHGTGSSEVICKICGYKNTENIG